MLSWQVDFLLTYSKIGHCLALRAPILCTLGDVYYTMLLLELEIVRFILFANLNENRGDSFLCHHHVLIGNNMSSIKAKVCK